MKVKLFGTRGSIPISRPDVQEFGGNTTCLRVKSDCLPPGFVLSIDAGSGYVPLCHEALKEGLLNVILLFSHWHHDHTQGLCLAPHTFIPSANVHVWGPQENGIGPKEVFQNLMRMPFFPVDFSIVESRFHCHNLAPDGSHSLVIHPGGRIRSATRVELDASLAGDGVLSIGGETIPLRECLIVHTYKTEHPQHTLCYRFEEMPTGRVFVFLTDHENTDGFPEGLLSHVHGAHLLVQDCQYSRERYDTQTKGFGHGTPDYNAALAVKAEVGRLGLTHHDPMASDDDIKARLLEAQQALRALEREDLAASVFACADYQELEV